MKKKPEQRPIWPAPTLAVGNTRRVRIAYYAEWPAFAELAHIEAMPNGGELTAYPEGWT